MRSTLRDARSGRTPGSIPALCVGLALTLLASGCGSGASTTTPASAGSQASNSSRPSTALRPATVPVPRLSIISPRTDAHTATTLTVGVALDGAAGGARRFRYVLDHRLTRLGSAHLTFHDLAPGRHRLEVFLATNGASRAATAFTVRAPAPVTIPAPTQTTPAQTTPMTTSSQPVPTPSSPSPPTTSEASPPPTATGPAQPVGGIPQGGGGDGDGDNSGGPSDGDGNK
jgi:hypothetical protein